MTIKNQKRRDRMEEATSNIERMLTSLSTADKRESTMPMSEWLAEIEQMQQERDAREREYLIESRLDNDAFNLCNAVRDHENLDRSTAKALMDLINARLRH